MNSNQQIKGKLGHVVKIHVCRLLYTCQSLKVMLNGTIRNEDV